MELLWTLGILLGVSFLLIVFRGAPFVPTRAKDVDEIFELHRFKKHEILVDLGSGDGRILAAAAKRGVRCVGYELNPFLVWYSRLKLRRYGQLAEVRLDDFWRVKLPDETVVVFVFSAGPFMKKLDQKLTQEAVRLGHGILLVSYGMKIPEKDIEKTHGGLLTYRYHA